MSLKSKIIFLFSIPLVLIILLIVLMLLWLALLKPDAESYDDLGLLDKWTQVPLNENGYALLLGLKDDQIFPSDLLDEAEGNAAYDWKKDGYKTLKQYEPTSSLINEVMNYSYIQYILGSGDGYDFSGYGDYLALFNYLYFSALYYQNTNDPDKALLEIERAMKLHVKIDQSQNPYLVMNILNKALLRRSFALAHQILMNGKYSVDSAYNLLSAISQFKPYLYDNSHSVAVITELNLALSSLDEYFSEIESERHDHSSKEASGSYPNLLFRLLVKFKYKEQGYPKNSIITAIAPTYKTIGDNARRYCADYQEPSLENYELIKIEDYFDLAKLSLKLLQPQLDSYYAYQIRHCGFHAAIEGFKLILASHLYKHDHEDRFPASIEELIPTYINEVPIDPFDGKPMRFNAEKAFFYSVGEDFEENWTDYSFYSAKCRSGNECMEKPTFPLIFKMLPRNQ